MQIGMLSMVSTKSFCDNGCFSLSAYILPAPAPPEVDNEDELDCEELAMLEEQGRYSRYVCTVEAHILRWNGRTLRNEEFSDLKRKLWRQLIITCNCFATRLIEKRKHARAMGEKINGHPTLFSFLLVCQIQTFSRIPHLFTLKKFSTRRSTSSTVS